VKPFKLIFSGGGTGGHIYPAISIAMKIKETHPSSEILFVGAYGKMEMDIVPKHNINFKGLWIDGFQRSLSLRNLLFPLKLLVSLIQAFLIIKKFSPTVVIGTGGFASGPLLLISQWFDIPTVIQEQNSFPGITNKFLGRKANAICVAFDGMDRYFPKTKIIITGNPVRKTINNKKNNPIRSKLSFGLNTDKKCLAVLGGSLGAEKINKLIVKSIPFFKKHNFQIIWQTGKRYYTKYKSYSNENVFVFDFFEEIEKIYSAADFIISRSGASTLSELSFSNKIIILIPSPNVVLNHQFHNAKSFEDKGAALLIEENQLDDYFEVEFLKISKDESRQSEMKKSLNQISKPYAIDSIIDEILKLKING
jgi:UDP-N-acetylglucosamine--N-acetylmuramyl-(pentapeptide) pyrophosphoryl-undecaprenol N-acetylglucosamine transferase